MPELATWTSTRQVILNEQRQFTSTRSSHPFPQLGSKRPLAITGLTFSEPATEIMKVNVTEMWEFINISPDPHPVRTPYACPSA